MGKLLQLTAPAFSLDKAKTVVTPGRSSIDGFLAAGSYLYVRYMAGGPSKLLAKQAGKPDKTLDIGPVSSVGQLVRGKGDQLLFESESYVEPPAWYRYDPASGRSQEDRALPNFARELRATWKWCARWRFPKTARTCR